MKLLSEFHDEQAMDALIALIDPFSEIYGNKDFVHNIGKDNKKAVKCLLEKNRDAVVTILAVLNETPKEEYHYSIASLVVDCLALLNDKELLRFFISQGQTMDTTASGLPTENIGDGEK